MREFGKAKRGSSAEAELFIVVECKSRVSRRPTQLTEFICSVRALLYDYVS